MKDRRKSRERKLREECNILKWAKDENERSNPVLKGKHFK
jgi:hypothetical protein